MERSKTKRLKSSKSTTSSSKPKSPALNLLDLPDLVLLTILESLPLQDLLKSKLICRRLYGLNRAACVAVRSLQLFDFADYRYANPTPFINIRERCDVMRFFRLSDYDADYFIGTIAQTLPFDAAELNHPDAGYHLTETFPNIRKLVIFEAEFSPVELADMIYAWRHSLTSLVLVRSQPDFDWREILEEVNHLPNLRHLSLFVYGRLVWNARALRQLESFYFAYTDYIFGPARRCLFGFLNNLSDRCQQWGFGFIAAHTHSAPFIQHNLTEMLRRRPVLASRLDRLKFPAMPLVFFNFLARHFTASLRWLDIGLTSVAELAELAKLPNLTHLAIRSNERPYSDSPLDGLTADEQIAALPALPQISSLFVLDFAHIKEEVMAKLFPNATRKLDWRDDDNLVDYPSLNDRVNFNEFDWDNIRNNQELAVVVQAARDQVIAAGEW